MVRVGHVGDEGAVFLANGDGFAVVVPGEDFICGGGVEGLAVFGEGNAMVELDLLVWCTAGTEGETDIFAADESGVLVYVDTSIAIIFERQMNHSGTRVND